MRLSSARVEQTLNQFQAQVIPDDHPSVARLKGLFGDHTFFLAANGLNIVEPLGQVDSGLAMGKVINLANWTDSSATSLAPHEPEATEVVVEFPGGEGSDQPH
jgi:hypothetical protein